MFTIVRKNVNKTVKKDIHNYQKSFSTVRKSVPNVNILSERMSPSVKKLFSSVRKSVPSCLYKANRKVFTISERVLTPVRKNVQNVQNVQNVRKSVHNC